MDRKKKKNPKFSDIIRELRTTHDYETKYELDYFSGSPGADLFPLPYDDFYAVTTFGSCEGIYTDFFVVWNDNSEKAKIACAKTLYEDDEAFIKMHELGALVSLELRKISIKNSYSVCTTQLK